MTLPNAEAAIIPPAKMRDYLLASEHPEGGSKAGFFLAMGFHPDRWQLFADAVREMITHNPVTQRLESRHGTKYIVEGNLMTLTARRVHVRTVWIIEPGESAPRFVTAYPLEDEP
jgi:hypothetical protein